MNRLTLQQRKLLYASGIAVALVFVILLGAPSSGREGGGLVDRGGKLAQLRREHELGESTLGEVDPSSATMNLVLLGFRGVAANLLWMQADEQKQTKQWAALRSTVDSITKLQPHFKKVWLYQGWNLAYNVSTEWDAVPDRYYWVKEGGKFLMEGTRRNEHFPDISWETGRVLGHKIGRSDEWRQFRRYYKQDPNVEKFHGGPDPAIAEADGRQFPDNYLAAKHWFQGANELVEAGYRQQIMADALFRSYPARAQFDYAAVHHREGRFDSVSREAWAKAHDEWTNEYGRKEFYTGHGGTIVLEADDEILRRLAERDARNGQRFSLDQKWTAVDSTRKMVNYNYWKHKAEAESLELTEQAHRQIYEGQRLFRTGQINATMYRPSDGTCGKLDDADLADDRRALMNTLCEADEAVSIDQLAEQADRSVEVLTDELFAMQEAGLVEAITEAQFVLEQGMEKYQQVLDKAPEIERDTLALEEALLAVRYYRAMHELAGRPLPAEYPLKRYWDAIADQESGLLQQVESQFQRQFSESGL